MKVTVTTRDLGTINDQVWVVIVTGTSNGQRVTFAGDHRPMGALLTAVHQDGQAIAEVEPWQIICRTAA